VSSKKIDKGKKRGKKNEMEKRIHRRHGLSDELWNKMEKLLPGREGTVGRYGRDNRLFINAVFWILRTGAPWRDLPPDFGD
jgi:transposase